MPNLIHQLQEKGLAHPPPWLPQNVHYITTMGSHAYGVASEDSDWDIYSFCIPPKEDLFPHLRGQILGFGDLKNGGNRFNVYQEYGVHDPDVMKGRGRTYDLNVYNIVDYFELLRGANPNLVDSIYTDITCVLHQTKVAQMVREKRKLFLSLKVHWTHRGYAFSQMNKIKNKDKVGKRKEIVEKYGYDCKFAYHLVRLLNQARQILTEGDLDLMRNNEELKSIRRGDWTEQEIYDYFKKVEPELETLYSQNPAKLPWEAPKEEIRTLLLSCLEEHYGNLDRAIINPDKNTFILREIANLVKDAQI